MELRDYLRIARRRWTLILTTTVAALGLAAVLTAQATPQYQSSARMFVSTSSGGSTADAYQGGLFSQQRVASYADIVNGPDIARQVVDDLQLDETPADLAARISARVVPETVLLQVEVTDPNRFEAQRINQSLTDQLKLVIAELETPPGRSNPTLKATVVDEPSLPTSPVSPQPVRNLALALVLGLLLGAGLAVLRELLDSSVKSVADVAGLEDVPVLGGLSYDAQVFTKPLITALPTHSPRVEAFRVLRTNLEFLDVDARSKTIVVTSSVPGEGKSTTSTNSALALAAAGRRVLLLDADLRRPQVAPLLGLIKDVGLTTVLTGRISVEDATQTHAESGLTVLTSGAIPPNPAELLQSQALKDVLADLQRRFEVIIIDAPPLLPVTDAALLAAEADGAVVVVRHGRTSRDQLRSAVERLAGVDGRLLGVVLNMVPNQRAGYGYGYGYSYGYGPEDTTEHSQLTWRQRRDRRRQRRREQRVGA